MGLLLRKVSRSFHIIFLSIFYLTPTYLPITPGFLESHVYSELVCITLEKWRSRYGGQLTISVITTMSQNCVSYRIVIIFIIYNNILQVYYQLIGYPCNLLYKPKQFYIGKDTNKIKLRKIIVN